VWIDRVRYVKLQCYFKSLFGWREIRVVRKGPEAKTGKYQEYHYHEETSKLLLLLLYIKELEKSINTK
jgi:hypothetical protein